MYSYLALPLLFSLTVILMSVELAGLFGYGPAATPLSTQSAPASIMDGSHCIDVTDAWLVDSVYSYVCQSMPVQCIAVQGVPTVVRAPLPGVSDDYLLLATVKT